VRFIFSISLIFCICFHLVADKSDSLLNVFNRTQTDTVKANLLIELFKENIYSNPDKALRFAEQGLKISEEADFKKGVAKFLRYHNIYYQSKGDYQKCLDYSKRAKEIYESINDKNGIADSWIDLGLLYWYQSDYTNSTECMQKALKIKEGISDKNGVSICLNNLGNIYGDQKNYLEALKYYKKSLKLFEDLGDEKGISDCLNNISVQFMDMKKNDSALVYATQALTIREKNEDQAGIAESIMSLGILYYKNNQYTKALEYYSKSLSLFEEMGDKNRLAVLYSNIGDLYYKTGHTQEAISALHKGLELAKELGSLYSMEKIYKGISSAYAKAGNFDRFSFYDSLYMKMQDSIFNYENRKKADEISAKYETEKKELQISMQGLELNKQKTVRNYLYGVVALVLLVVIAMIAAFRTKQKANRQLQILNAEIIGQKMEIEFKNDELNKHNEEICTQRDEIEQQKSIIEEKNREVMDSIHYAKRIQQAVLPTRDVIESSVAEFFIFFRPKDIVSGDFYWAARRKNHLLIAAADCTGHGVPGAFMSMLGMSFLNEIVPREDITTSSQVLDELRKLVIESLQQKGVLGEQKDGMDMAFCALDVDTLKLQYAGANNPLMVASPHGMASAPHGAMIPLREIKADKQPIAIFEKMTPFTNHVIQLQKGDSFYIFSDGYADQFGGSCGKKMLKKRFHDYLIQIKDLPMEQQQKLVEEYFDNWRGAHSQIDDVLVIGVRV